MYRVEFSKRAERKFKKLEPSQINSVVKVIEKMEEDPFQSSLKTHKLTGALKGFYSCSISYSDRIIFIIVIDNVVTITDIGSHDDVY